MFKSNQQNKDLCELKSSTSKDVSQESTSNTDNIVGLFGKSVTYKTEVENNKCNSDETSRINSIFSFVKEEYSLNGFVCSNEEPNIVAISLTRCGELQNPKEHYCCVLNNECKFCGALHFADEANRKGLYKSCCHFGKVKLQEAKNYPKILQNLMVGENDLSKNFKSNIRSYNSALSFALMGANIETISNGPYCFKIHGQVYHNVYNVNNNREGEIKKYSQLYVLDTEMATDIRLQNESNFN